MQHGLPHSKPFHGKHDPGFSKEGAGHPRSGLPDHRRSGDSGSDFSHSAKNKFPDKDRSGDHVSHWPHGVHGPHLPPLAGPKGEGHPAPHHPHGSPHHKHPLPGKMPHGKSTSPWPHGPKGRPKHAKPEPKPGHGSPHGLQRGLPQLLDGADVAAASASQLAQPSQKVDNPQLKAIEHPLDSVDDHPSGIDAGGIATENSPGSSASDSSRGPNGDAQGR
mmetsp:Transcript_21149/g.56725  ORF Transcript_21149/g.56725 Transcript_21149/m.56725 type:complete len:219 (+) Transcript_21149:25-681(+)